MATTHALTIEPDQKQLLEELAAIQLRSPEILVREAIDQYLASSSLTAQDLMSPEDYAQMLADAEESWKEYQRTGLHVTHEEISEWVERLQHDPKAPMPVCHT